MNANDRFATRAASLEETPDPFRTAIRHQLTAGETIRTLVFGPSYASLDRRLPATLLAVTSRGWILALDDSDPGCVRALACGFDNTLLIELTELALDGHLRVDYLANGRSMTAAAGFNTVMNALYRDAADMILAGIEGGDYITTQADEAAEAAHWLQNWPMKFSRAVLDNLRAGRRLLDAVHWPAVYGGFGRELAPAAAMAATARELLLISDERRPSWDHDGSHAKVGTITTYFPLSRLGSSRVASHGEVGVLELQMHAGNGGEVLKVLYPADHEPAVRQVMDRVSRRAKAALGPTRI